MKPSLSRAEKGIFYFFILWMLIGLVVTLAKITDTTLSVLPIPSFLATFLLACLHHGDPFSIILAAINTHWLACRTWGPALARRWAGTILLISAVVETIGTLSGWPFGPYHYTENFGPQLFGILPFVIPFSWLVLLTNVLFLVRHLHYLNRRQEAVLVGLGVTFLDWVMEPFAVQVKAYWFWDVPTIPWQNYLTWFFLSFLLVRYGAPTVKSTHLNDLRPAVVLGMIFALFLCARIVNGV